MDTVILPLTIFQTKSISRIIREQEGAKTGENETPQEEDRE